MTVNVRAHESESVSVCENVCVRMSVFVRKYVCVSISV